VKLINTTKLESDLVQGHSEAWLKIAIILVGITFIVLAFTVKNKWALAVIFLYGILP
jgi:hypothetical protein